MKKKLIVLGIIVLVAIATAFAIIYPTRTIVDTDGDILEINADGSINGVGI